jgi:hypothetical protein
MLSKNCCSAIPPDVFSGPQLDKSACYNSKALEHYHELANLVVQEYENHVRLCKLSDPDKEEYLLSQYHPSGGVERSFDNAAHPFYDSKAFRGDEFEVAKALDKHTGYVWARNKDRLDYGIPLPIKSGGSSAFYADFLWWVKGTVWAIDPTGKFILSEKLRTKLMAVPPPLKIALITKGKLSNSFNSISGEGWSLLRFRTGSVAPENFDFLDDLTATLVDES